MAFSKAVCCLQSSEATSEKDSKIDGVKEMVAFDW